MAASQASQWQSFKTSSTSCSCCLRWPGGGPRRSGLRNFSGGLAATGGALVLRPLGGSPIDAVGWGDALNAFVEGGAAAAPTAGSSIERRPGGPLGHGIDSNDNAADFALFDSPTPGSGAIALPEPVAVAPVLLFACGLGLARARHPRPPSAVG